MQKRLGLAWTLFAGAAIAAGNTYTVTSTADAGAGTLRQAILDANTNPGADTIAFGIVGSGLQTISPVSALPPITGPVTIDGYTQSGSSANTNPTSQGLNTVLRIELNGTSAGSAACLSVQADDVTIRGLAINRCTGQAIEAVTVSHQNLVVEGCFLGSSADGTQALTPYGGAISLGNHTNARIGGTTPAARNLIAGGGVNNQITIGNFFAPNSGHLIQGNLIGTNAAGTAKISTTADSSVGIFAGTNITIGGTTAGARNVVVNRIILGPGGNGTQATGNFALGNYIGTDVTGLVALGCNGYCISANHQNNTIGGSAAGAGNVIAGATGAAGIEIKGDGTVVQGNFIGTDPTETAILPNAPNGIYAFATGVTIGGTAPGEGNVIAHNGPAPGVATQGSAVLVDGGQQVTIRGNSIYDTNGQPSVAIDLRANNAYGITFNDAGDADSGPNGLQNFPIIASVGYGASTTTVAGVLNSTASTVFDLDFYATTCARWPQEIAEAPVYLGSAQATTDGSGNATFNSVLPVAVPAGSIIAATATSPSGSTSELSPRFVLSMTPGSGPAAGGTAVQIKGLAFEAGATVTVGGAPATNVVVTDANTITANVPARPAGTINPVVVQNPSAGLSGTLANGWLADFNDVPAGAQFRTNIIQLVVDGITAGIGGGNYGPTQSTLRQQMAVFLLKAKYGICYVPPPCSGTFPDVPCPSGFAPWIEALAAEGITGGCGGGNYCPGNPVLRQQMAVFLLKAEHGSSYVPPACSGTFADVPCTNQFAPWVEQLGAEGITGGCGGGNFCPLLNVTRGQMAVFLVKTFKLP